MGKKTFKCPTCKKKIKLDKSCDFGYCTFCGTKIQIKQSSNKYLPQMQNDSPRLENVKPTVKPWYKKWWVWVIIGIAFCSFISVISESFDSNSKYTNNNDSWEIAEEKETETAKEKETETTKEKETETSTKEETTPSTERETETTDNPLAVTPIEGFTALQSVFLTMDRSWTMDDLKNISMASGLIPYIDEGDEADNGVIYTKRIQVAETPYLKETNGSEKYAFSGDYIWAIYRLNTDGSYFLDTAEYIIASNGIRVGLGGSLSRGIAGTVPSPAAEVDTLPEILRYALDKPRFNGGNW